MKRYIIHIYMCIVLLAIAIGAKAQGIPFLQNFSSSQYHAHNRNFDVISGTDGIIYFANFEGLLYYDRAQWRIVHTAGTNRLTAVFRDKNNIIYTGGYHNFGRVITDHRGSISIRPYTMRNGQNVKGEVTWIWQEKSGEIRFLLSNQQIYRLKDKYIELAPNAKTPRSGSSVLGDDVNVNQVQEVFGGLKVIATNGQGLITIDPNGYEMFRLTEENGLCSNHVNHITYDGHGGLWGATDAGIFVINFPSVFSHFVESEGLKGEVLDINTLGSTMFVGTINSLYRRQGMQFQQVAGINHACWQIQRDGNSLLAATSSGVFRVQATGAAQRLTNASTTAVYRGKSGIYCGEMDGIYLLSGSSRVKLSSVEKVVKFYEDKEGNMWVQNLSGEIWMQRQGGIFNLMKAGKEENAINTLVIGKHDALVVNMAGAWRWNGSQLESVKNLGKYAYPQFSSTDDDGYTWLTNQEGKNIYAVRDGKLYKNFEMLTLPLRDYTIRAVYHHGSQLWLGGDFGLVIINNSFSDPLLNVKKKLCIRTIVINGDSTVFGGFGKMPESFSFSSNERLIHVSYSIDYPLFIGTPLYRYRLNGGAWSSWSAQPDVTFNGLAYGGYKMEIQGRDATGKMTDISTLQFSISYPWYLKWYMNLIYAALAALVIYMIVRLRMRRLEMEKLKLEQIVQERTADLKEAQNELIRQEKMATVGKLTQGLIDRILNPMNYINNFAKLSRGLVNDINENIEDEKDNMDEENYEDTLDVLDMLNQNLEKVELHGQNATRTLKAMESILQDRSGGMEDIDIAPMLKNDKEILHTYYKKDIDEHHIAVSFDIPEGEIRIHGNEELLSKTIMSLVKNAFYAVEKKLQKQQYQAEIKISVAKTADKIEIKVYDNGIGIEESIVDKIFDPFFTTKTTGEAAGVGLYLSREIMQNHGGDITVKSMKDQYSEFMITMPAL